MNLNVKILKFKARTIEEIKVPSKDITIPIGTEFIVMTPDLENFKNKFGHSWCESLDTEQVYHYEFELIDSVPLA